MRALRYQRRARAGVALVETARPGRGGAPRRGCVVVDVVCASLNPVDAKYLLGDKLPAALDALLGRRLVEGQGVGFDFAGVVASAAVGTGFQVGDRVFGTTPIGVASIADQVATPAHQVAAMPRALSFAEAAALPLVGLTALQIFRRNGLCEGQRLLLLGAGGGVGHVALQVARALGARVTAVAGAASAGLATKLGAEHVLDYTQGADKLQAAIAALAVERPFDLCLDTVTSADDRDRASGYPALVAAARSPASDGAAALKGRYVNIGGRLGDWLRAAARKVCGLDAFPKERELFWIRFPETSGELAELAAMAERGVLRPVVAHEVAFKTAAIADACEELLGRRVKGKLVVRVREDPRETNSSFG